MRYCQLHKAFSFIALIPFIGMMFTSCVYMSNLQSKPDNTWATEDKTLIIDFNTNRGLYKEEDKPDMYLEVAYPPAFDEIQIFDMHNSDIQEGMFFKGGYSYSESSIIFFDKNGDVIYTLYPADELTELVIPEKTTPADTTTETN